MSTLMMDASQSFATLSKTNVLMPPRTPSSTMRAGRASSVSVNMRSKCSLMSLGFEASSRIWRSSTEFAMGRLRCGKTERRNALYRRRQAETSQGRDQCGAWTGSLAGISDLRAQSPA